MAASYPQVLIAQRTYFQVQADYIQALTKLRQKEAAIRGLLLTGLPDPRGGALAPFAGVTGEEAGE